VRHSKFCLPMTLWVMSAGRDPTVAAAHVRFAPKATGLLHHINPPLRAKSGHSRRMTCSARAAPSHSSKWPGFNLTTR
jgi:hypothetical protein